MYCVSLMFFFKFEISTAGRVVQSIYTRPMSNFVTDKLLSCTCSNAANVGERKTWTQSEFCTWQNSVRGGKRPRKCIYSIPAQETAKHRALLGWPPVSDVAAVTKPRRETG